MRKAHHLLQAALVFVMLALAFSPLVSVAQEATPTVEEDSSAPAATGEPAPTDQIVADPDSSTVEADEGIQNLSPLAEPPLEISINGETEHVILPGGDQTVIPDIPNGAEWRMYPGANCTGGSPNDVWLSAGFGFIWHTPGDFWLQARWENDHNVLSNCLRVTITNIPVMTVAGATSATAIVSGSSFKASSSAGSEWSAFPNATCTEDVTQAWFTSERTLEAPEPGVWSFRARLTADNTVTSACIPVTFVNLPTLTANGSFVSIAVPLDTSVWVAASSDGSWYYYWSADCSGGPAGGDNGGFSWYQYAPKTMSFQPYLRAYPSIVGNCVTVTWREATPTVSVNGHTTSFTVPVGTTVNTGEISGAEAGMFEGNSCEGDPGGWSATQGMRIVSPGVYSFQARWAGDDSTRGNCVTVTWEPVSVPVLASIVCGNDNDVITAPMVQTGITVSDSGWSGNHRTITLSPVDGYTFPSEQQTVFEFTDDGPCVTDAPIPPVQMAICGIDNDTVTVPDQPAHLLVSDTDWVNGERTITFSAVADYVLPSGTQTEYVLIDAGLCETAAPIPPTQSAVCGIDNDTVIIPDQPENVLVSDTGWVNGQRTITFSAADDYMLPVGAQTEYIFTDAGLCETAAPIPPTQSAVCGIDNDTVTIPDPPAIVLVSDTGWVNGQRTITFSAAADYTLPSGTQTEYVFTDLGLCETAAPIPPVQTAWCGINNDTVTVPDQPANVVVSDTGWVNGERTITFSAADDYVLPAGSQTEYVFIDLGLCETAAPIPPVQTAWCGINNDTVTVPDQPANVVVSDTGWVNGERTITFSAADDYVLPAGSQTEYVFTDAGLCETAAPIPPTQSAVCGIDNDTVTIPDQPENVLVSDSGWVNGERTITFSAADDHVLPSGTQTEYVFIDAGLCEIAAPIPPVQSAVCGIDNDTVSIPDQPANVLVSDTGWVNGERIITFSAADDYVLPIGTQTEYVFTDEGPCVADSVNVPVQTAVCGPDNDSIDIPEDQPVGISFGEDSGWIGNQRTISFDIDPNYTATGESIFTFVDDGTACPPATSQVNIHLVTSDGGSVVGTPYELYAPTASLAAQSTPYLQGTVDEGNTIDLGEIMVGTYRLVVTASGYETLDTTFVVADEDTQTIELPLVAPPLAIHADDNGRARNPDGNCGTFYTDGNGRTFVSHTGGHHSSCLGVAEYR